MSDYYDLVFGCDSAAGQDDKIVEILGDDAMGFGWRSSTPPQAQSFPHHHRRRRRRWGVPGTPGAPAPYGAPPAATTATTYPQIPAGWPPPPYPAPPDWPASVPYPPPGAFPGSTVAPTTAAAPGMYQAYPGAPPTPLPPGMTQAYPGAPLTPVTPAAPTGPQPTIDVFVGACLRQGVPAAAIVGCLKKKGYGPKQISDAMGRCL